MKIRFIIITALLDCELSEVIKKQEGDFVICADGGVVIAEAGGIVPDVVLGDLDSTDSIDNKYNFIRFPKEKDDTDTMLCLKYGIEKGYRDFVIIGGIGGRLDHTIANIQTLAYAKTRGIKAKICSCDAVCQMISDGETAEIERKEGFYVSIFSYSQECEGVSISGTKYVLENGRIDSSFPLGVSNEFASEKACISVEKGNLLIILAR